MTLNQVVTALETIATNHQQINSFGFGDIWEQNSSGTIYYPQMFVEIESSNIAAKKLNLTMRFYFMDVVKNGEVNENEVLSDQLEIAKDVIAQLQHNDYDWIFDAENVPMQDFTENLTDSVAGWSADITLEVPYTFDRCAIPMTPISVEVGGTSVRIYDQDGNTIEQVSCGGSYQVTVVSAIDGGLSNSTYTNSVITP